MEKRLAIGPISPARGPLYQQIVRGIKREIGEGRLEPGAALPPFRALAEQLTVSGITVRRAYEELEREGVVYRRQGSGTYVSTDWKRDVQRAEAEVLVGRGIRAALESGMRDVEVYRLLSEAFKREKARIGEDVEK